MSKTEEYQHKMKEGVDHLKEEAAHLRDKAEEGYRYVRERAQPYQQEAHEFIDSVGKYAKENPQTAAMIAGAAGMGIGIILGMLMRGNRH